MRLLFPVVNKSNYTQCVSFLKNNKNWKITCVHLYGRLLSLALSSTEIDNLKNLGAEICTDRHDLNNIEKDYIIPVWTDTQTEYYYDLSLSTNYPAPLQIFSKTEIYGHANQVGIATPKIYTGQRSYPLIAKPISGTGGTGVKKIYTQDEYDNFFSESEKPHDYFDLGKSYQVEEYIPGPVTTIMGCVLNGKITLGPIYDIDTNIDEYFATSKASIPSVHNFDDFIDSISKLLTSMNVDNTPFIMDVITNDKIYLIDFSCRIGGNELIHTVCGDWGPSTVDSILNGSELQYDSPSQHYIFQSLPFKKGTISNYTIDVSDTVAHCYPSTNVFHKAKNIESVLSRGYIIVKGNTKEEAEHKLANTLSTLIVR